jgi:hypothetical protein
MWRQDPKKAALDVADYQSAISWASQTALRDVIGKTMNDWCCRGSISLCRVRQPAGACNGCAYRASVSVACREDGQTGASDSALQKHAGVIHEAG